MIEHISFSNLILVISIVILSLYWWFGGKKYNLPSGPRGFPVIGYLPFLQNNVFIQFKELSQKYGNIFSINLGGSLTVILNDYESVKEAFNNPLLLDRPPGSFDFHPGGLGFVGENGAEWIEQRRHTMTILKEIGLTRSAWEADVEAEVEDFVKLVETYGGKPVDLHAPLAASASNNMTSMILGKRLLMSDPRRQIVYESVDALIKLFNETGMARLFPNLMRLVVKLGLSSSLKADFQKMEKFNAFIRSEVRKRKESLLDDSRPLFIDGYLQEIEKLKEKKVPTSLNEKNLIGNSQTVIIGGSETMTTTLSWLFLIMATNPKVQKKVQDEIDLELGREGKVNWMEKIKVPYTYATILEGLRYKTVAPLAAIHRAAADTKLGGFDIPKDTNIMANVWALHNDPKYWKNPEEFVPERFLMEDGTLMTKKPESYAPFSVGRRICPGEFIALMEIFHYFVAMLQNFTILPLEDKEPCLEGKLGGTFQTKRQQLRFVPRG